MNTRIAEVRKNENLTQEEFASRLGLSRNFVWMLEKGDRIPSDRTINDICREFGINESWLRYSTGDMKAETTQKQKLTRFFADVLATAPDDRSAFVAALDDLPPEFWPMVAELARNYVDNLKKEETQP